MNRVVQGLEDCLVYLDDLLVYSDTWESHLQWVRALWERLAAAQLTVDLAKCDFARATVTYLAHVVGQGKVSPFMAKVLSEFPQPTTKKEQPPIVFPLTELLKTETKYVWSSQCQQVFENVKSLLCSRQALAARQFNKQFLLQVDASQVGAGAVLFRGGQWVLRPVCFFSRKFNRHSVGEKDALALILALQHFEVYMDGMAPLIVYTDHNPFLGTCKSPNRRLTRWSLFLRGYDLEICHIKGQENVLADTLSRAPIV